MNSQSGKDKGHKHSGNQHSNSIPPNSPDDEPRREPSTKNRKQTRDQAYWERRQYRVQRMIAYAGLLGIVIYGLQLWEMRKSTDAATKAAKAAEDSVQFANKSARVDQRAWVGVMTTEGTPEVGKRIKVSALFKNTGKTFASKVTVKTLLYRIPNWSIPDFDGWEADVESKSNGLMPPEGTAMGQIETIEEVTEEEMSRIETGETVVYFFGKITYSDIFGCDHWITYCYILYAVGGNRASGWRYDAYRTHNEPDSNCGP